MTAAQRPARGAGARRAEAVGTRAAAGPWPAAALVLVSSVLAMVGLRGLASFAPGRWLWGLDVGRDLPPGWAVAGFALPLVACVPAIGRRVAHVWPGRAATALAVVSAAALAVFLLRTPDRSLYIGDASLRHGAFAQVSDPGKLAEQAMRGDLLLHHAFPRWAAEHSPWTTDQVGRGLGALLAAGTLLAGWRLASLLGASGVVGFAVAILATATGALALDTGYGKATVEIAALATVLAVGVVHLAQDRAPGEAGTGLLAVGVALALALLLHRSALVLVPAWIAGTVVAFRAGRMREAGTIAGFVAPPVALALVAPRLWQVLTTFDRSHHASGDIGATIAAAFAPLRLLDSLNALLLLVPLVPLLPVLLAMGPRPSRRAWALIAVLVLPPLALLLVVQPQHELPRDWDVFALAGSVIAVVLAWRFAEVLRAEPGARVFALPVALAAALPALQWVALQSHPEPTWSRAESILLGPPARRTEDVANGLGTLGMMRLGRGQPERALALFERSAEQAPNPRMFVQIGMAEAMLGRPERALVQYRHAASLNPDLNAAWRGMAAAASALGDAASMREALTNLERLEPGSQTVREARTWLEANPGR